MMSPDMRIPLFPVVVVVVDVVVVVVADVELPVALEVDAAASPPVTHCNSTATPIVRELLLVIIVE